MDNEKLKLPQFAWINCRETFQNSRELGDVVIPGVNVREKTQMLGKILGQIPHGSKVVVAEKEDAYYKVSFNELNGWIQSIFVTWDWSTFTFFGKLRPNGACKNLDITINDSGYELVIKEDNFALVTEGNPDHFDIIKKSVINLLDRLLHAQALSTSIPLVADFTNWVETPATESKRNKSVGFVSTENINNTTVSSSSIQDAYSLANLVKYSPYFDLALSDFSQALRYPQHALIFLSRAIESLENSFEHIAKNQKGKGKEDIFVERLGLTKDDVVYVTKRANTSHRRHASKDAKVEDIPQDELTKCFNKTSNMLSAFAEYLRSFGFE